MLDNEEDTIKKLAQDIIEHGLNPTESLVVYNQNGKYLIQEGNRRVVALKLLNNPDLVSDSRLHKFFMKLRDRATIPSDAWCTVYTTHDGSRHWVMLKHTGKNQGVGTVPWNPIQKQRFSKKSSKLVKVVEYIGTDLDVVSINQSTLERLISTPYVQKKIGIKFSSGNIKELETKNIILQNFKLVLSAMSKKDFSVRRLDRLNDRKEWIDQVLGVDDVASVDVKTEPHDTQPAGSTQQKPHEPHDTQPAGSTQQKPHEPHDTQPAGSTQQKPHEPHDTQPARNRKYLIPKNCDLPIEESRIRDIFLELRNALILNGKNSVPNAVAVLFRVFLEASLDKYIDVAGIILSKEPRIKEKINEVAKDMEDKKLATRTQLLVIRSTATGRATNILNIQWFNQFVHNYSIEPDGQSLNVSWNNLQEFFEILWQHINSKG